MTAFPCRAPAALHERPTADGRIIMTGRAMSPATIRTGLCSDRVYAPETAVTTGRDWLPGRPPLARYGSDKKFKTVKRTPMYFVCLTLVRPTTYRCQSLGGIHDSFIMQ
jgi:hypothetical protein